MQISSRGMYVGTGYYRVEPDQLERSGGGGGRRDRAGARGGAGEGAARRRRAEPQDRAARLPARPPADRAAAAQAADRRGARCRPAAGSRAIRRSRWRAAWARRRRRSSRGSTSTSGRAGPRTAAALGVRVGLDLDAERRLARAELPGAAVLGAQRAAADGEVERGDRAVRAAVLAARRVGVDPGDELRRRAPRSQAADRDRPPAGLSCHAGAPAEAADAARARRRGAARRWRSTAWCSGPTLTRPSATSSHASGAPSKPTPCSQIQRSACSAPQLWPITPGQASSSQSSTRPEIVVSGSGLSVFVRGSGAS